MLEINNSLQNAKIVGSKPVSSFEQTVKQKGIDRDIFQKSSAFTDGINQKLESIPTPIKETADNCATTAKYIQRYYDLIYGKDNWEYVSIGRSCSKIADCIDDMGTKAYTIPISGLTNSVQNGKEIVSKDGFSEFKNYIYSLGLNPTDVEKSGKTYIFQDFSDSGKSIARFEEFIKSPEMGLNKDNVVFESINSTFENIFKTLALDMDELKKLFKFNISLANQSTFNSIKTYTNVKKLPVENLKDITKGIFDSSIPLNKDFEFALKHFCNMAKQIV